MSDEPRSMSAEETKDYLDQLESDEALYASLSRQEIANATYAKFAQWLHLPDPSPVYFTLAVVAANRLDGDPVWGQLVGAPGSGKTEILNSITKLPGVHVAATLTEPALLSGTPKRDAKTGTGGLLRQIGEAGIILAKDFGSILNMHRDQCAAVLMALREIYDGSWTRLLGTDGGKQLKWSGKVGFLAGVTEAIDQHHSVQSAFGERFLTYRMPETDSQRQAAKALEYVGYESIMRHDLADGVLHLFQAIPDQLDATPLGPNHRTRLVNLASLTTRARSAVERDPRTRDITHIHQNEGPARLVKQLANLYTGLTSIGIGPNETWRVITKAAFDSIPPIRNASLDYLAYEPTATTTEVAEAIRHPTSTTRRALEELTGHGVVTRDAGGQGKADKWKLSPWANRLYHEVRTPDPEAPP